VNREPLDPGKLVQALAVALSVGLFALLAMSILEVDDTPGGLTETVAERMGESGVAHPVTGVLLNFRAYDTWLEVAVLLLAAWGALVLRQTTHLPDDRYILPPGPVLGWLIRMLIPLAIVVGVYVLWLGTDAPGGAFQAGAVIGAAAVLLRLSGFRSIGLMSAPVLRLSLIAGFAGFLIIAVVLFLAGWNFLQYPPEHAGTIILVVELLITWSVAVSFVAFFVAARPQFDELAMDEQREGNVA
jgi:multisubunit Na+/H+ antiporter MnhB subunit